MGAYGTFPIAKAPYGSSEVSYSAASFKAFLASISSEIISMYPKNAATPPEIDLGQLLLISDGSIQTSGASVRVKIGTGSWGAGAGTPSCDATSGIWTYAPTQAETNAAYFIVGMYKASCTALSKTVVTTISDVAGYAGLDWSKVNAPTTTLNLSGTTVATVTTTTTATNLTNAPTSGDLTATMKTSVTTAATAATPVAASVSGAVGSVTGNVGGSVVGSVGSIGTGGIVAGSIGAAALNGKGDWNVGKTGYALTATTGLGNQTADITGTVSTVTTAINLTNAPTAGDLTATMKASVTTAATAATPIAASVAGAVGSVVGLTPGNLDVAVSTRASQTSLNTLDDYVDTEIAAIQTTLGTPAGVSMSADVASVKTDTTTLLTRITTTFATLVTNLTAMITGSGASAKYTTTAMSNAPSGGGGGGAAGSGSTSETLTITVSGQPADGVAVWVSTDIGGTNVVAGTLWTDAFGEVTFLLDPGNYYCWKQRSGDNFTNPETFTVA